jgi:hypothetical protein
MPIPGFSDAANKLIMQIEAANTDHDVSGSVLQAATTDLGVAQSAVAVKQQAATDAQGSYTWWTTYLKQLHQLLIEQLIIDNGGTVPNPTPVPNPPPIPTGGVPIP